MSMASRQAADTMSLARRSRSQPNTLPNAGTATKDRRDVTAGTVLPPVVTNESSRHETMMTRHAATSATRHGTRQSGTHAQGGGGGGGVAGGGGEPQMTSRLLQDHVTNITTVVTRLSKEIEALQGSIKSRDDLHVGTNHAVQKLEVSQVTTLTEVKGRLANCDSALVTLGTDVTSCFRSIRQLQQQEEEIERRVMDRLSGVEKQITGVNNQLERASSQSRQQLSHIEGDTSAHLAKMDDRTRHVMDDVKAMMSSLQGDVKVELERSEQRITDMLEKDNNTKLTILDKLGQRVEETLQALETRVSQVEVTVTESAAHLDETVTALQSNIHQRVEERVRENEEGVRRLKKERQEGFTTLRDNVDHVHSVLCAQHELLANRLSTDIHLIRQIVD